jgi:hypothetical protein
MQRLQNKQRLTRVFTSVTLTAALTLLNAAARAQSIASLLPEIDSAARAGTIPAPPEANVPAPGRQEPPNPDAGAEGSKQPALPPAEIGGDGKAGDEGGPTNGPGEREGADGTPPVPDRPPQPAGPNGGFRWGPALKQSLLFLAVEHGFRVATEPGTRADLKGPFFKDWFESAGNIRHWRDGDPFYVNYVGHSMQGAVTGFIQIQNDPDGVRRQVGWNREYWRSRRRAFWWSTLYSTQFELGPLSESSIGNVGLRPSKTSRHPQAFVDMVITPTLGTAWLVGEDWLDQKLVRGIERKTDHRVVRLLARSFLNPGRSFANLMRGRWFWYRDGRKL